MPGSELCSDEDRALRMLSKHLQKPGQSGFTCLRNSDEPPDLLIRWTNGHSWGVEVTRTYLRLPGHKRPATVSSMDVTEPLSTFGNKLGESTKGIRKRNYTLDLGPSTPDSLNLRPMKCDKRWKKDTEEAIQKHIRNDSTERLRRPGVWLKPGGRGNRWTVITHPGVQDINAAAATMIRHALRKKVEDLPRWNEKLVDRWLLLLNHYPLVPDASEIATTIARLIRNNADCTGFDGIFWNSGFDESLVSMPVPRVMHTERSNGECLEWREE